jgi:hypothetical protein
MRISLAFPEVERAFFTGRAAPRDTPCGRSLYPWVSTVGLESNGAARNDR